MAESIVLDKAIKFALRIIKLYKHQTEVQKEFGSFDKYIWQFTGFKVVRNKHRDPGAIFASSPQSDAMSADLRKRGFKFVGTTICYAFMQATGMVNDHLISCFRYSACGK